MHYCFYLCQRETTTVEATNEARILDGADSLNQYCITVERNGEFSTGAKENVCSKDQLGRSRDLFCGNTAS